MNFKIVIANTKRELVKVITNYDFNHSINFLKEQGKNQQKNYLINYLL